MRTAPGGELKESEIPHWGNRLGQRRNIWGWWDSEATDLWLSEWNANHTDNPCCSHMYPEQGCCVTSFSGSVNPNFCDPMDCSTPCFPIHHQLPELTQTHIHQVGEPSNHLVLCCPLLLLSSVFPSFRVFSNESALHIRWPKYWNFSFSICPSNEHSGLISFSMDWLDLLAVQGTLKSLLQHHSSKASILQHSAFFIGQL